MKIAFCQPFLGVLGLLVYAVSPVTLQAQSSKIFVASFGNDANDGSRGSPKRNFQAAHNAVAANGEIVVLDTAGYGALTITKSVGIIVPPGVNGFVTVTGTNNAITIAAGASSVVSLRGLIVEGGGSRASTGNGPGFGIYTSSAALVIVEDCTIRNFLDGLPWTPSNLGGRLVVRNTTVQNCAYGLDVQSLTVPNTFNLAHAVIDGCHLDNNNYAIIATGNGGLNLVCEETSVAHCDQGVYLVGSVFAEVSNSRFTSVRVLTNGGNGSDRFIGSRGNNLVSDVSLGAFDTVSSQQ